MTRAKERKEKLEEEEREKKKAEFIRKAAEAKIRHAKSRYLVERKGRQFYSTSGRLRRSSSTS